MLFVISDSPIFWMMTLSQSWFVLESPEILLFLWNKQWLENTIFLQCCERTCSNFAHLWYLHRCSGWLPASDNYCHRYGEALWHVRKGKGVIRWLDVLFFSMPPVSWVATYCEAKDSIARSNTGMCNGLSSVLGSIAACPIDKHVIYVQSLCISKSIKICELCLHKR